MLRNKLVFMLALGLSLPAINALAAPPGMTIKKCQDATGLWHYGDTAADECAKSKITVMTEEGTTKKVIAAPPTEEELKERAAHQEATDAARAKAEDQAKKDALLLATYGGENDITYIRDRKIAQIESTIKASEDTLKSLRAALGRMEAQATSQTKDGKGKADKVALKNIEQTRAQIARHESLIADKRQEQEAMRKQYAGELARYREIKKQQATQSVK
ncbi:MAG: hypothetical protein ACYDBW_07985 [Sulfuricaulis sp.]